MVVEYANCNRESTSSTIGKGKAFVTDTLEWLRFLYDGSPGFFVLTPFKNGAAHKSLWYGTDQTSLKRAARTIDKYAESFDLYVSVATHREKPVRGRGSGKTVTSIPGFWADLDIGTAGHKPADLPNPDNTEQALEIIKGLPKPSAIVHSGGGLQVYWKFDKPWVFDDPTEAAKASDGWQRLLAKKGAEKGFHVDTLGALPQILRVAGSQNHKLDNSRPVKLLEFNGPSFPAAELCSLGIPIEREYHEDAGNDPLGTWEDILLPHGCTIVGTRESDGATLWTRPGKSEKAGHSFVTDPYGAPVLVNFSASWGLPTGPNQRLTKFKVWALLNYDGDMKAAKQAFKRLTRDSPARLIEIATRFSGYLIDWQTIWTETPLEPDWICAPLIERGKAIVIYSNPKCGKSLLLHEICAGLTTGRSVLGNPGSEPVKVLYIDEENTRKDVAENMWKFGYGGTDFKNLAYYSFPSLDFLDTEEGARQLYALAKVTNAELVILDTLSRMVQGGTNDPDTFTSFYKYTGRLLKAEGVAILRMDHTGKDRNRGMIGASTKATDVDYVWELGQVEGGSGDYLQLTRTHARQPHGGGIVMFERVGSPTPGEDDPTEDVNVRLRTVVYE